jgi:hypothetical protein
MKKYLILIILICAGLLYANAHAAGGVSMIITTASVEEASSDFCSSCTGTSDADVFCEDLEGSSACGDGSHSVCQCTFDAVTTAGTNSVDFDDSPTAGSGCTETDSYTLLTAETDNSNTNAYVTKTFTGKTTLYVVGTLLVVTEDLSDGAYNDIFALKDSSTNSAVYLELGHDATDIFLKAGYYNGSGHDSASTGNLSGATHYPFRITWVSGSSCKVEIDLNNDGDYADANEVLVNDSSSIGSRTVDRVYIGTYYSGSTAHDCTIEWNNIKFDDDTMPSQCAR